MTRPPDVEDVCCALRRWLLFVDKTIAKMQVEWERVAAALVKAEAYEPPAVVVPHEPDPEPVPAPGQPAEPPLIKSGPGAARPDKLLGSSPKRGLLAHELLGGMIRKGPEHD